jgi:heme exporter protein D
VQAYFDVSEASMVYKAGSMTVRTLTQRNKSLKKTKKKNQRKKKQQQNKTNIQQLHNDNSNQHANVDGRNFTKYHPI